MTTRTEEKRRSRIAAGRHEKTPPSFDQFYRHEYAGMVAIARALVAQRHHAEDLVQEAFISAHRNWERVGVYDSPRLWVRRVLINRATSLRRRLGSELKAVTRIGAEPEATTPDLSVPATEVWEAVRRLPRRQQQVVVLRYVTDLSVDEIGQTLDCSPGTVKAHLHRARRHLETTLSTWEEE